MWPHGRMEQRRGEMTMKWVIRIVGEELRICSDSRWWWWNSTTGCCSATGADWNVGCHCGKAMDTPFLLFLYCFPQVVRKDRVRNKVSRSTKII